MSLMINKMGGGVKTKISVVIVVAVFFIMYQDGYSACQPTWSVHQGHFTICPQPLEESTTWKIVWWDDTSYQSNFASGECCFFGECPPVLEEPVSFTDGPREYWSETAYDRSCDVTNCVNNGGPRTVRENRACPRTDIDQDTHALEDDPLDCDDNDSLTYPGAATYCEAMDRNCNGEDDRNEPDPQSCGSPVLVDLAGNGFDLTNSDQGVLFNLTGVGAMKWSWTAIQSDDAWLVLDRNDDGIISDGSELFGCITQQTRTVTPNGFIALAEYDKFLSGGNGDGLIDPADSIFASLQLWQDMNHNGVSEPYEMLPLSSADILAIELGYKEAGRQDRHGNRFRYRAKIRSGSNSTVQRWAWDVFLTLEP